MQVIIQYTKYFVQLICIQAGISTVTRLYLPSTSCVYLHSSTKNIFSLKSAPIPLKFNIGYLCRQSSDNEHEINTWFSVCMDTLSQEQVLEIAGVRFHLPVSTLKLCDISLIRVRDSRW